ncbi:glucokinase [Saliniramus sp.]|uniref:glucokinase n=1 Tax=Saliniramus sp. TaxID=2986772 RepID=UPI002BBE89FB|nr:glucokinase [Saliniramus sp.]HMB12315.1 glucokinase [Saliniramus sp.]
MSELSAFAHPLIVADIGGTNARFALTRGPGEPPRLVTKLATAAHAGPEDALNEAIAACGEVRPRAAIICAAGPVTGRTARLTNAPWHFDGPAIAQACGLEQGLLLNDFEAAALSLAFVEEGDVSPIGPTIVAGRGPKLVLGPGTGLGVAALARCGETFLPLPGEGGHVGIGPQDAEDDGYWPRIARQHGRVTAETLLCGPGLQRLHAALASDFGADASAAAATPPPQIAEAALAGTDAHAATTARVFLKLLARTAGDLALVLGATGGVFLRGGVLHALARLIEPETFRRHFTGKAPVDAFARAMPLALLLDDAVILRAMAGIGADPQRFALAYGERLWCA